MQSTITSAGLDSLHAQELGLLNSRKYDEAIILFDHITMLASQVGDSFELASSSFNLGVANDSMQQHPTAARYFMRALGLFSAAKETLATAQTLEALASCDRLQLKSEEAIRTFDAAAIAYHSIGAHDEAGRSLSSAALISRDLHEHERAVRYAQEALDEFRQSGDSTHVTGCTSVLCVLLCDYAEAEKSRDNIAMADSLFSRALIQARSELGAQHHDYFLVLISRGAFLAEERQYAGAESCYVEVIRALQSQPGKDPQTLWIAMGLLGLLYENADRSDEASILYAKEIDLRDQLSQDVDEGYAENLGDLARVYTRGQHFERASKVLLRALRVWQSLRRAVDPRALECKMSLGRSYLMMDSLNLAERVFKELTVRGQTSPDGNDTLTIDALGNLALTYSKLDRFQEAERCFRHAYKLCKLSNMMGGTREARILGGLGSLEYEMGNYSEAESLLISSNTIWKSRIKDDSLEYARSLNDLAALYFAQGRSAIAEETFSTAREFLSHTTGKATPEYLTVLNNLGVASVGLGRYRDARDILTRVITLQHSNVNSSSLEYARSLNNLGLAYLNLRQYPIAESLFTQARACLRDSLGMSSTIGFQISLNLVRVWKERGDLSKSITLANDLVYQGRTRLGQYRVLYPESLYLLAMVYYTMRDYSKADSILTESNRIFKSMLLPTRMIGT